MTRTIYAMTFVVLSASFITFAIDAPAGEDDILVGRSAAHQLKLGGVDLSNETFGLPCVSGILQGWALDDPGFDHVSEVDIDGDLYPLDTGAQIRLVCISIDAALRAISPSFAIIDAPGESLLLGGSALHIHLTWHINSTDPNFAATQTEWSGTFKLIDTGSTGYAESAPFTLHFKNGDCLAGDTNDDGVIDGRDVQSFIPIVLDPPSATPRQQCLADCNRDCTVSDADIAAFVSLLME